MLQTRRQLINQHVLILGNLATTTSKTMNGMPPQKHSKTLLPNVTSKETIHLPKTRSNSYQMTMPLPSSLQSTPPNANKKHAMQRKTANILEIQRKQSTFANTAVKTASETPGTMLFQLDGLWRDLWVVGRVQPPRAFQKYVKKMHHGWCQKTTANTQQLVVYEMYPTIFKDAYPGGMGQLLGTAYRQRTQVPASPTKPLECHLKHLCQFVCHMHSWRKNCFNSKCLKLRPTANQHVATKNSNWVCSNLVLLVWPGIKSALRRPHTICWGASRCLWNAQWRWQNHTLNSRQLHSKRQMDATNTH